MRMKATWLCLAIGAAASILGGCAGDGARRATQNETPRAKELGSPVVRSELRERALGMLVEMTSDPDAQIRANAAEAMAEAPARLSEEIERLLRDGNQGVRAVAGVAAGRGRLAEHAPAIRGLLNDPSPYVRASAMYALASMGADVDMTPMASILLNNPSPNVRSHVAFLLGELGDVSARGLLRQAVRQGMEDAPTAEAALLRLQLSEALVKLGDARSLDGIRAALYPATQADLEATAVAAQILGEVGDRASIDELVYLTARLDQGGNSMPAEVRLAAAWSLARLGKPQGSFIAMEFVDHERAALRRQAAHVMGEIGGAESLAVLEVMLDDPSPLVRVSACAATVLAAGK
jgi:HEAT repeat protein